MSSKIQIATSTTPDWYYLVDASQEQVDILKTVPGTRLKKDQFQIHKTLPMINPEEYEIVYDNKAIWFKEHKAATDKAIEVYETIARPYQRQGADFILQRSGTVLADEVGVGKSVQAVLAAQLSGMKPVLVMGTLLSSQVWCSENGDPKKFFNIQPIHLQGRKGLDPTIFDQPNDGWWYCHYDILEAWLPWIFTKLRPKVAIFDEVHKTSFKAKRGKAALAISRFKEMSLRIVISATPVRNKRIDMWMPLDLAQPDCVGERHLFGSYFCSGQPNAYGGMDYNGESHNEELKERLKELFIRRTKADVMAYLPSIIRQGNEIELNEASTEEYTKYKAAEKDIRAFLKKFEGKPLAAGINGERLIQLGKLLSILSRGKASATAELAADTANLTGKCVVFCWFKDTAKLIAQEISKKEVEVFGPITGNDPVKYRIEQAELFAKSTEPCVYVATLASASESINELVACQELIISDLYWNPLLLIQAEGRLHRSGQKGSVHVVYMTGKNTIDTDLLDMLFNKASTMETLGVDDSTKMLVEQIGGSAPDDNLDVFIKNVLSEVNQNGYALDDEDPDED